MIGKFLETLTDEQLNRVADAVAGQWVFCLWVQQATGARCLLSHVADNTCAVVCDASPFGMFAVMHKRVFQRYDSLCKRVIGIHETEYLFKSRGAPRAVVMMIQNRARKILATRQLQVRSAVQALGPCCASAG